MNKHTHTDLYNTENNKLKRKQINCHFKVCLFTCWKQSSDNNGVMFVVVITYRYNLECGKKDAPTGRWRCWKKIGSWCGKRKIGCSRKTSNETSVFENEHGRHSANEQLFNLFVIIICIECMWMAAVKPSHLWCNSRLPAVYQHKCAFFPLVIQTEIVSSRKWNCPTWCDCCFVCAASTNNIKWCFIIIAYCLTAWQILCACSGAFRPLFVCCPAASLVYVLVRVALVTNWNWLPKCY